MLELPQRNLNRSQKICCKRIKHPKTSHKNLNRTTYKDSQGRTHKRTSAKGTKRGDAYCAPSSGQKQTEKVQVRRKAWACRGKESVRG